MKYFLIFILTIQTVISGENIEISIDVSRVAARPTTLSTISTNTMMLTPFTILNTTSFLVTSSIITRKFQTSEPTLKPTFLKKLNKPFEKQGNNSNITIPAPPNTETETRSSTAFFLVLHQKISKPTRETTQRETTTSPSITTEISPEIPKLINQTFSDENLPPSQENEPDSIFVSNVPTN